VLTQRRGATSARYWKTRNGGRCISMDPFVSTIAKQALVWGLAAGAVVTIVYFTIQHGKLQYALSLNITPPQVQ